MSLLGLNSVPLLYIRGLVVFFLSGSTVSPVSLSASFVCVFHFFLSLFLFLVFLRFSLLFRLHFFPYTYVNIYIHIVPPPPFFCSSVPLGTVFCLFTLGTYVYVTTAGFGADYFRCYDPINESMNQSPTIVSRGAISGSTIHDR